ELRLRLHAHAEGLGTVAEGLLALSEDGWIVGANSTALELLGLPRAAIGATPLEQALGLELCTLWSGGRAPRACPLPDGRTLWLRLEPGRSALTLPAAAQRTAPPTAPPDALAALDGGDASLQGQIERARRVLDKPIALLLQGESGVGKELFARACHDSGSRRGRPFVALNCAALPEGLIEAELFGYRPGAFTGAAREGAPGRLREAQGGTLFLDEIGDMPLPMQARLLRVLQERQVQPLGGGAPVALDFALICATHRPLRREVEAGRFREDLFYRINGLALRLPPLRERSDLAALVARLLREIAPQREIALASALLQDFRRYRWPGNVRQLANALRTACALLGDAELLIGPQHLPDDLAEDLGGAAAPAAQAAVDAEADLRLHARRQIERVLQDCAGNVSEAARRLGISRNTLYRQLRAQGLAGRAGASQLAMHHCAAQ
ncbi:MAG TPA: sigma 54-interacting transcriptional regulator, partial [Roseateles sp.]|nr:sigma 54-interacting transcriptional regulator [Roseateles sp.]